MSESVHIITFVIVGMAYLFYLVKKSKCHSFCDTSSLSIWTRLSHWIQSTSLYDVTGIFWYGAPSGQILQWPWCLEQALENPSTLLPMSTHQVFAAYPYENCRTPSYERLHLSKELNELVSSRQWDEWEATHISVGAPRAACQCSSLKKTCTPCERKSWWTPSNRYWISDPPSANMALGRLFDP